MIMTSSLPPRRNTLQTPGMRDDETGTAPAFDAGMQNLNAVMAEFDRGQQQALQEINRAMLESNEASSAALDRIMNMPSSSQGYEMAIAMFKQETSQAIGNITKGVEKHAEFQQLQVQSAAATGRLGTNAFAIARNAARMSGEMAAEVWKTVGEMQMEASRTVAGMRMKQLESESREREVKMSALVGLAGAEAQAAMQYAGIVAGMSSDRGQALVNLAQLSTNLVTAQAGARVEWRKISAGLEIAQLQAGTQLSMQQLQLSTERAMQQRLFDADTAARDRAFQVLEPLLQQPAVMPPTVGGGSAPQQAADGVPQSTAHPEGAVKLGKTPEEDESLLQAEMDRLSKS